MNEKAPTVWHIAKNGQRKTSCIAQGKHPHTLRNCSTSNSWLGMVCAPDQTGRCCLLQPSGSFVEDNSPHASESASEIPWPLVGFLLFTITNGDCDSLYATDYKSNALNKPNSKRALHIGKPNKLHVDKRKLHEHQIVGKDSHVTPLGSNY